MTHEIIVRMKIQHQSTVFDDEGMIAHDDTSMPGRFASLPLIDNNYHRPNILYHVGLL